MATGDYQSADNELLTKSFMKQIDNLLKPHRNHSMYTGDLFKTHTLDYFNAVTQDLTVIIIKWCVLCIALYV